MPDISSSAWSETDDENSLTMHEMAGAIKRWYNSGGGGSGFTWRDAWSGSSVAYDSDDVVFYDGSAWICNLGHTSNVSDPPGTNPRWDILAQGGADGAAGATGATGPAGADGTDGVDGLGITWRNAWSAAGVSYAVNDAVLRSGSAWICVSAHTSSVSNGPGDLGVTEWQLMASKGDTGSTGAAGADGADGADGVGVPAGGTSGQVLAKFSNTSYDVAWKYLDTFPEWRMPRYMNNFAANNTVHVSGTASICYIGRAPSNLSSVDIMWGNGTVARSGVTYQESAIYTGAPATDLSPPTSLTRVGYTTHNSDTAANTTYVTSISVSSVSAGDHMWFVRSTSATTMGNLRVSTPAQSAFTTAPFYLNKASTQPSASSSIASPTQSTGSPMLFFYRLNTSW